MKTAFHLFWAVAAIVIAIGIGIKWYNGEPANVVVWTYAILGCLLAALSALRRAFP